MVALLIILAALGFAGPGRAWGQETTVVVDMDAEVSGGLELTISPQTINFPDANPDSTPNINATENPVMVTVHAQVGKKQEVLLTAQAQGDLASGTDTIPIGKVRWTANGGGFVAGTMSKSTAVTAGSWSGQAIAPAAFRMCLPIAGSTPRVVTPRE